MLIEKIQLDENEEVLSQVRRHWFVLFTKLIVPVILAFVPPIFFLVIQEQGYIKELNATLDISSMMPVFIFGYLSWLTLLWMIGFTIWTHYYLDVLTITNERIILVDQRGMFSRTVASFRLERMQDIYVEVNGLMATLLDYGTIHAETASDTEEEFKAAYIPRPRDIKATVLRASDDLLNQTRNINNSSV